MVELFRLLPPAGVAERVLYAFLALGAALVLVSAYLLDPDPRGTGTHSRLGLAPCVMMVKLGMPCPFCGMTTSFAHLAKGRLVRGILAQPFGLVLFALTLGAIPVLSYGAVRGSSVAYLLGSRQVERAILVVLLLCALSWGYKVAAVKLGWDAMASSAEPIAATPRPPPWEALLPEARLAPYYSSGGVFPGDEFSRRDWRCLWRRKLAGASIFW